MVPANLMRIVKLMLLRLDFLDAQYVGALAHEPLEKALARGRTYPVGIERDDSQCRAPHPPFGESAVS